jgi:hypothetical protein
MRKTCSENRDHYKLPAPGISLPLAEIYRNTDLR